MRQRGGKPRSEVGRRARRNRTKAAKVAPAPTPTSEIEHKLIERTRELEQALQQQRATDEVLSIISRSRGDAQPVFETIVESATRLCDSVFSVVYLYANGRVTIAATRNFTAEATARVYKHQEHQKPNRSFVGGRAILDCAVTLIPDVLNDPKYSREFALAGGWRAVLAVPLLHDGQAVGAITVGKAEPNSFSDQQIQLLKTFADQAVIAIENTRLFDELRQRTTELTESLAQQTATAEILRVTSGSPTNTQPVFEAIVQSGLNLFAGSAIVVSLADGKQSQLVAAAAADPAHVEAIRRRFPVPLSHNYIHSVAVLERRMVDLPDADHAPPYLVIGAQNFLKTGNRAITAVPMMRGGLAIGAISVIRRTAGPLSDKQKELLRTFADQAVIAIENTRMFKELRERTNDLTESLAQQTATADVLKIISRSTFDLEPVLETLLESATRLCDGHISWIFQTDGQILRFSASYGHTPEVHARVRQFFKTLEVPIDRGSVVGRAATEGSVVHISDVLADPDYTWGGAQKIGGYRACLGAPLLREGKVVGVLFVAKTVPQPFSEKQIELVKTFADQAVIAIENTRLLNELRESLEQQTATANVLQVISSSPDELNSVFNAVLENATRLCSAKFANLVLFEEGQMRVVAMHNAPPAYEKMRLRDPIVPLNQSILRSLVRTKKLVHVTDITVEEPYASSPLAKMGAARSALAVPMLRRDGLVGAIAIYHQEVRPFTDKQIELLQSFAAQAVVAIENARLLNELRESLQQQTATSDVLKVISSSLNDLKPVFETIGQRAEKLCDAEISVISMVDADSIRLVSAHGITEAAVEAFRQVFPMRLDAETVTARTVRSGAICHIPDVFDDPLYETKDAARVSDYRACLGVPMTREGQVIGTIFVARKYPGRFADSQVQLLKTFADQAVVAVENVRLFSETKEALAQQTATADVLKVISRSTFDLRSVLQTLVESAVRLCDADSGVITREKNGAFYRTEGYGFSPSFMEYVKDIPIETKRSSVSGRALLEGRVVHIPDVKADLEYSFEGQRFGNYRTALGVPMMREGRPIGVLSLTRSDVRPFTGKQLELVTMFADQAAIAIENVRLFESVEARTRDLTKSLEDLQTAQDRLVQTEKLASLGQLTAGIAHEIKNPLNFVNNFSAVSAELIDELRDALAGANLDSKLKDEISEIAGMLQSNLEKVVQHGKRADSIVKNMLLHSRQGSGEHRLIDINGLVEESLNLAYHGARAEKQGFNIRLERSFDPAAGEADLFPQEITRVLINVIANGFYATTKRKELAADDAYEPTLTAMTKNVGDSVEIKIRDNGTGIPPEAKEKLFSPFFTTKPVGEGTGLGLSISHDIVVKQHSGRLDVDSKPGEYTEFRIILPRTSPFVAKRGETP